MNSDLIMVDIFDNPIGFVSKEEAHKKGVLHRAFSVFIYHGNKILLQKRAKGKYHSGGLLTNTCCSHPRSENITEEAQKRLFEETGIKCNSLHEIFSFNYFTKFDSNLFEYEIDHVFIGDYYGPFEPNKDEVETLEWFSFDDIALEIAKNPQKFTTWFLIALPKVIEHIKNEQTAKIKSVLN